MSDINSFEIIQNKLDALVEKIVQKENSDEDFRITYAQILEKINTKMDLFSNDDTYERINLIGAELNKLLQERQEVIDAKFNAVKGEFDNLNEILLNSLKTPELLAAFNKIQNQIHYFSEEQESQKFTFNSIISHIEKFGTLEETNDNIRANFAIVKEQNTIINENVNKQIDLLNKYNSLIEENNQKLLDDLNTVILSIREFSELTNKDSEEIKKIINEKIDSVLQEAKEADTLISVLNNNLTTLMQVVGNIFDDESFQETKSDIADILVKTAFLSEAVSKLATKDELLSNSEKNKEEIKENTKQLVGSLEEKILAKLDFSSLEDIKNYTEKMFFQGTEVLKEEMWAIKDNVANFSKESLKKSDFDNTIHEFKEFNNNIKEDLTDVISEESVATSDQLKEISTSIEALSENTTENNNELSSHLTEISTSIETLRDDISENNSTASSQLVEISTLIETLKENVSQLVLNEQKCQIEKLLQDLQSKFVTQLVQIADNISFDEQADDINENIFDTCKNIKEKITTDIESVKNDIQQLQNNSLTDNNKIVDILSQIDDAVNNDITSDLKTLISSFKLLTSGVNNDKDYLYTLPDIESDLSKIRVDLQNIQKTLNSSGDGIEEDQADITSKITSIKKTVEKIQQSPINSEIAEVKALFTGLNEDISSISKRTNKLIIASDEVNKALKSNVIAFTSLINNFEKQSKEFYNSTFMKELDTRIENLSKMTASLVQSDQVMTEAFMYMGEWIDTASDSFDEIKTDVSKMKKSLLSDEAGAAQSLELTINNLSQKVVEQDTIIGAIDEKLNQLVAQQQETKELKSLIDYVASQVSLTNEKVVENDKLAQKIANIEKQLKKIEKNVAAITEYIDEDDSEEDEFFDEDDSED